MTKDELKSILMVHADTYMIFNGGFNGVRKHFRQEDWFLNNREHSLTVHHLTNCLFQMIRIKFKSFGYISEERRNAILERELDEALLCKALNKILNEMDT